MSEIDRKIEDKKLQLGSLNDELKDTVGQVEEKHLERERLTGVVDDLKLEISTEKEKLDKAKEGHAIELTLYRERVEEEESTYKDKQGVAEKLILRIETKDNELKKIIKNLELKEKELKQNTKDFNKNKAKLRELKQKVKSSEETLKQFSVDIDTENKTLDTLKNRRIKKIERIKNEKTSHK